MCKPPEELAEECKNKIAQRDIYAMGTLTQREQDYLKEAFLAGYQAAAPQWISVKERLPPPEVNVLWWNETADQAGVSSYKYMSHCNDTMIEWGDAGNISIKNFTHWMPLTKPPEEA
jgi:hypothetical protein